MKFIALRLEGPLQSWGENSKWDYRDTADTPTKSGVIGLIACCAGYERGDERIVELNQKLTVSTRIDVPGCIATDFHTVHSNSLLDSTGKPKPKNMSTIVSYRSYLQDASFMVVIGSKDNALLDEVVYALNHPVWVPTLGRKCCYPSKPIFISVTDDFDSVEDVMRYVHLSDRCDESQEFIRAEIESPDGEHKRNDVLVNALNRTFTARYTKYITIRKDEIDVPISTNS